MAEKIMIAMDDSENALRAVSYVATHFRADNAVTLFSVVADTAGLCDMNSPELTPLFKAQQSSFCQLEDKKRNLVQEACLRAKAILVEAGWDKDLIQIRTEVKRKGVAHDIVREAKQGFNLIVLGKHGLAGIRDFFLGSTSQKVIQLAKETSVLVVN
ncbi:MAG: universal stress protein [Desulfobacterales bacterium]|mgnify:CR=1 FL=1|jgi:nucleotide-binding universal stress UspA family protein